MREVSDRSGVLLFDCFREEEEGQRRLFKLGREHRRAKGDFGASRLRADWTREGSLSCISRGGGGMSMALSGQYHTLRHTNVCAWTTTNYDKAFLEFILSLVSQAFAFKYTSMYILLVNITHLSKYIAPCPFRSPIWTKPFLYPSSNSKGAFQTGTSGMSSRYLGY